MKKLIIKIKWGGLGDHLFHTPIPKAAKLQGYDKVYISNKSDFVWSETRNFVWGNNPYVDGFCAEDIETYPTFGTVEDGMNLLDTLMLWYGLKDDGIRFREPEIFYTPKFIPKLKDAVIFDPNFGTGVGHPSIQIIEKYLHQNNIKITHQMKVIKNNRKLPNFTGETIKTPILETFCDIIYSCSSLYCFNTGTAPLAASLAKAANVFCNNKALAMFRHSSVLNYIILEG